MGTTLSKDILKRIGIDPRLPQNLRVEFQNRGELPYIIVKQGTDEAIIEARITKSHTLHDIYAQTRQVLIERGAAPLPQVA